MLFRWAAAVTRATDARSDDPRKGLGEGWAAALTRANCSSGVTGKTQAKVPPISR